MGYIHCDAKLPTGSDNRRKRLISGRIPNLAIADCPHHRHATSLTAGDMRPGNPCRTEPECERCRGMDRWNTGEARVCDPTF